MQLWIDSGYCRPGKPEKDGLQFSLMEGEEYEYFYFVTNAEMSSKKIVIVYEKRGNAENYIKETRYDLAVGHLLLQSFWANTLKNRARVKPSFG